MHSVYFFIFYLFFFFWILQISWIFLQVIYGFWAEKMGPCAIYILKWLLKKYDLIYTNLHFCKKQSPEILSFRSLHIHVDQPYGFVKYFAPCWLLTDTGSHIFIFRRQSPWIPAPLPDFQEKQLHWNLLHSTLHAILDRV